MAETQFALDKLEKNKLADEAARSRITQAALQHIRDDLGQDLKKIRFGLHFGLIFE